VKASLHPTHRVCALGPLADKLVKTHHFSPAGCGPGTPFDLMASAKTVILGIGVEYEKCLTQIHTAEDLLGDQFPVKIPAMTVPVTLVNEGGDRFEYTLVVPDKNFNGRISLLRTLLTKEELVEWKYHGVPMFFTTAGRVTEALCEAALKGITIYTKVNQPSA
jgi:aminoglycoside 3-N-acetyltransferase